VEVNDSIFAKEENSDKY